MHDDFYGYGLGYFGKLGMIAGIFVCIGIYGIQLIGSYMYVQKFQTGPVEKLLRIWTNFSWSGKPKEKSFTGGSKSSFCWMIAVKLV